ncbi:MAG: hypothetical protein C5B58_13660 [Acidobacteria bacterium]|nr:MAG: hypothetical protein C5B58_13660 [Acidobacteriota bacterium]
MKFEHGNKMSGGRPRGSRNRWTNELIDTMFRHFLNSATAQPAGDRTKIEAAMDVTYKQRPADYFKAARDLVSQLAPKLQVSGSLTDLTEEQLDKLDAVLEQLEAQPPEALN